MPLPPYIKEQLDDQDRYQTVLCKRTWFSCCTNSWLAFYEELLTTIRRKGIHIAFITLHVGLGTFRPVSVDDIHDHEMHAEYYRYV